MYGFKVVVSLSNIKEEFWKVVSLVGYEVEVRRSTSYPKLGGYFMRLLLGCYLRSGREHTKFGNFWFWGALRLRVKTD